MSIRTIKQRSTDFKGSESDSDAARWEAVLARRPGSEVFFYGVKSTGIYCRPTCGARRPKSRDGVEFFDSAEAADEAGYRSCRRCQADEVGLWQADLRRVQQACRILESHAHEPKAALSLSTLAEELGSVSPFHLQRSFKRILGISPRQYADAVRLRKFKAMLHKGQRVCNAARDAGFKSFTSLYGHTVMDLGMSPSHYLAGAPGAAIVYAILPCPLGFILLAATERGVCSLRLADTAAELEEGVRAEFPKADLREEPALLGPFVLAALSAMGVDREASEAVQDLPLDIRATAFQWRVWLALRVTPSGSTFTYGGLAAAIAAPGAARAVGTACGANPVALTIPCHRVIPSNGKITGYRWGSERKDALLKLENKG